MIDMTKQYTYQGKPVRIYADGSDTTYGIHCGVITETGRWDVKCVFECDLVEVWEPKEGDLCFFWDDNTWFGVVGRYADIKHKYTFRLPNGDNGRSYKYCSPFTGTLPEAFKGL